MSNYLIISFLHLGSHYLFSVRSQQDTGRKVRQVKSVMRRCRACCKKITFYKGLTKKDKSNNVFREILKCFRKTAKFEFFAKQIIYLESPDHPLQNDI